MRHLLGGLAAGAILLAGLIWTAPATAAPITPAAGFHAQSAGLTDVRLRRYRVYRRYYPRYRYYNPYPAPYYYGPSYYPYYRPYYRPGFYIGTPFFGFGF